MLPIGNRYARQNYFCFNALCLVKAFNGELRN